MQEINWESIFAQFMREEDEFEDAYRQRARETGEHDFYIVEGVLTKYFGPGGDVEIPESVAKIADMPFYGCRNLTSVTIPESVMEIGDGAFAGCPDLTEIRVAPGNPRYCMVNGLLMEKDGAALHSCPPGKTGTVTVPEGVARIAGWAFAGCRRLTHITIPMSVVEIGEYAFGGLKGVTCIFAPKNIGCMANLAFYGCKGLTGAAIPESPGEDG